jgi:HNH endonuclease
MARKIASFTDLIAVDWIEKDCYKDIFAVESFSKSARRLKCLLVRSQNDQCEAMYSQEVRGNIAVLDYRGYRGFNEANGVIRGVARLVFRDARRDKLEEVHWKALGDSIFRTGLAVPGKVPSWLNSPYNPKRGTAKRAQRSVKERPGQAQFRKAVFARYNSVCCITNCSVYEALEAAHIDPHENALSDHPANGLPLRLDLHGLFDANHLAIDPYTFVAHFSKTARRWKDYDRLHRKKIRINVPSLRLLGPDLEALKRRWKSFHKSGG